jgi:cell division protein FtsL
MKRRLFFSLITILIIFSIVFSACSSGVPQSQYNQLTAQLAEIQSQLAKTQSDFTKLQADKTSVDNQLKSAQAQITALQSQVSQSSLVGATPAETAAKIVKNYHDTHVYSAYDLFVCSDMASEVWNMLKAQNISSVIVIGKVDVAITDILQSDHAWIMATVAPGQYLALETTGGYVVKKTEHPLYYQGWAFNSPADLKSHNDMVKEYNIRVGFRNTLNAEANKAAESLRTVSLADLPRYKAVYDKLVELRTVQETTLGSLNASLNKLGTPVTY